MEHLNPLDIERVTFYLGMELSKKPSETGISPLARFGP